MSGGGGSADGRGQLDGTGGAATTILERMLAAGIAEPRAREHLTRSVVLLAGEPVSDPDTAAPWPIRWVINPA